MKKYRSIAATSKGKIISLILAGGKGVRLWPLSTPENPKPFLRLIGGRSFLRLAYERALKISLKEKIFISTLQHLGKKVLEELPEFPAKNLILEPEARNTAPAIALGAMTLQRFGKEAVMAVFPADHYIEDSNKFRKAVLRAAAHAREGDFLVTFGVKPESPSTEYGYIEVETQRNGKTAKASRASKAFKIPEVSKGIFKVRRFTEKPGLRKAKSFLRRGNYYWNSGMFVWRSDTILKALQKHAPDILECLSPAGETSPARRSSASPHSRVGNKSLDTRTKQVQAAIERAFSKVRSVSIDYAIMEKADNCYMVPLETTWKDFGSWLSVYEYLKKDGQ
ncbi:MAG: mannose-1-phosphate guanylyltransferase [Acidobacteriota bacterium]